MSKLKNLAAVSSAEQIQVLIVVDTNYIKQNYPNPSQDPTAPTGIDHNSQFMIAYDPRGIVSGQGTADLNFKALAGDYVSFYGTSIEANSDDAVIVYGIKYWSGDQVFNNFQYDNVTRSGAVMPQPSGNGLPPQSVSLNFLSYDTRVARSGTENFYVFIAVYQCLNGNDQTLYGYFYWDPTITVS